MQQPNSVKYSAYTLSSDDVHGDVKLWRDEEDAEERVKGRGRPKRQICVGERI